MKNKVQNGRKDVIHGNNKNYEIPRNKPNKKNVRPTWGKKKKKKKR